MKKKQVWTTIALILSFAMAYGNGKESSIIKGWEIISSNIMKIVVHTYAPASDARIVHSKDLTSSSWQYIAHSDVSNGIYAVTNLEYSTVISNYDYEVFVNMSPSNGSFGVEIQ